MSTNGVEEGEIMFENKILRKVVNGINDGYDMFSSVSQWIDEDIFELFDGLLSKGIELSVGEKDMLLIRLISTDSKFLMDNIIYLKLLNLYNKVARTSGENQELYCLVNRVSPNDNDLASVVKHMQDFIKEKDLKSFVEETFNYDVLLPYKKAREDAKLALVTLTETDDEETLKEALKVLDSVLTIYEDREYIVGIIVDNRKEAYCNAIEKFGIDSLAKIFCEVNGGKLTNVEKLILLKM